jgi:hypothetical protein
LQTRYRRSVRVIAAIAASSLVVVGAWWLKVWLFAAPSILEHGPIVAQSTACPARPADQQFVVHDGLTLKIFDGKNPVDRKAKGTATVALVRRGKAMRCVLVDGLDPTDQGVRLRFVAQYWTPINSYRLISKAVSLWGDVVWWKIAADGSAAEYWLPNIR